MYDLTTEEIEELVYEYELLMRALRASGLTDEQWARKWQIEETCAEMGFDVSEV